ncbi:MAG: hypothetical protein RQ824_08605 [bacterium]|nr:hypothetical protein [bacterium]
METDKMLILRPVKYGLILFLLPLAIWTLVETGRKDAGLIRIASSHTCMGSNRAQERPQSYAEVGGKRYYGCTDMCILNLKKNSGFRYGIDPVSGKMVDKATSIVGARENGELIYFESEEHFRAYRE